MKKILIVVDMQNDFITDALGSSEAEAIVPAAAKLIKTACNEYDGIIFTMDTHYNNYMDTLEGKMLPVPHCLKDSEGWQIRESLLAIVKTYNAEDKTYYLMKETFGSVNLPALIMDTMEMSEAEEEIEFHCCGLCTDICVVSNMLLLRAHFPDDRIVVHANACAGTSPVAHEAALTTMKSCQIEIEGE